MIVQATKIESSTFEFDSTGIDAADLAVSSTAQHQTFQSAVSNDLDFDAGEIAIGDDDSDEASTDNVVETDNTDESTTASDIPASEGVISPNTLAEIGSETTDAECAERDEYAIENSKPSTTDAINNDSNSDNEVHTATDPFAAQEKEVANLNIKLASAREYVKALRKELDAAVEVLIGLQAKTQSRKAGMPEVVRKSGQGGVSSSRQSTAKPATLSIVGVEDCDDSDDNDNESNEVGGMYWQSYYPEPDCEAESWEIAPTEILWNGIADSDLSPIKGFGPKKQSALAERCPTVGDLERLRAGAGIRSIKSFGEELAGEIENRLIDFLSLTRDAKVFGSAGSDSAMASDGCDSELDSANSADSPASDDSASAGEVVFDSTEVEVVVNSTTPMAEQLPDLGDDDSDPELIDINEFAGADTEWVDADTGGEVERFDNADEYDTDDLDEL